MKAYDAHKARHLRSIFAIMKMTIAPKTPPPASRYTIEYIRIAATGKAVCVRIVH